MPGVSESCISKLRPRGRKSNETKKRMPEVASGFPEWPRSASRSRSPRWRNGNGRADRGCPGEAVLSTLCGASWMSSQQGKLVTIEGPNDVNRVGFRAKFGHSLSPDYYDISVISAGARNSDFIAISMNGWQASGVRRGMTSIEWHKAGDEESPITWRRLAPEQPLGHDVPVLAQEPPATAEAIFNKLAGTLAAAKKEAKAMRDKFQAEKEEAVAAAKKEAEDAAASAAPTCKICLANPVAVALIGCGHTMCETCMESQCVRGKPCFFCKIPYAGKQAVFFS